MKPTVPSDEDDLSGFGAPTEEQERALREGFAAHVSTNAEFRQAVNGLMRTQHPRPSEVASTRGWVKQGGAPSESIEPPAPIATPVSPANEEPDAEKETLEDDSSPADETSGRGATQLALPSMRERSEIRTGRGVVVVVVGALVLVVIGLAAYLSSDREGTAAASASSPQPVAPVDSGRATATAVSPLVTTDAAPASATPLTTLPSVLSKPVSAAVSPTAAKPTSTALAAPTATATATPAATAKDPDSWRFNP